MQNALSNGTVSMIGIRLFHGGPTSGACLTLYEPGIEGNKIWENCRRHRKAVLVRRRSIRARRPDFPPRRAYYLPGHHSEIIRRAVVPHWQKYKNYYNISYLSKLTLRARRLRRILRRRHVGVFLGNIHRECSWPHAPTGRDT